MLHFVLAQYYGAPGDYSRFVCFTVFCMMLAGVWWLLDWVSKKYQASSTTATGNMTAWRVALIAMFVFIAMKMLGLVVESIAPRPATDPSLESVLVPDSDAD